MLIQSHKCFGAFIIWAAVWWDSSRSLPDAHRNLINWEICPQLFRPESTARSAWFLHILPIDCFQISTTVCFLISSPPWTSCFIILTSSIWGRPSFFHPSPWTDWVLTSSQKASLGVNFLLCPSVVPKSLSWHELALYWPWSCLPGEGPWLLSHATL